MIAAAYSEKDLVVDILAKSFDRNSSVNFIAKQDGKRKDRIRSLMDYSFEVCHLFGKVLLSADKKACALILFPEKKKNNFKTAILDIRLIRSCIGIRNIKKALDRESKIKKVQPREKIYYLWFIGVDPAFQGKGAGTALLTQLIEDSVACGRPVCLETSTPENIIWYKKFGFKIYQELDLGYRLFLLKRDLPKD